MSCLFMWHELFMPCITMTFNKLIVGHLIAKYFRINLIEVFIYEKIAAQLNLNTQ